MRCATRWLAMAVLVAACWSLSGPHEAAAQSVVTYYPSTAVYAYTYRRGLFRRPGVAYYAAPTVTPVVTNYAPAVVAPTTAYYAPTTAYYAPTTAYYAPAVAVPTTTYYAPQTTYYAPQTTYYVPQTTYYAPAPCCQ
jgi:hypothetical protein